MKLYIKNMVCSRCKMVVQKTFEDVGLHPFNVELGEVTLREENISEIAIELSKKLEALGFEILDNKSSITIDKIKRLIIDLIQHNNNELKTTLSHYLSKELRQDYSTISQLFSEVEGLTIEKYYILQKIEKVKELLVYDELTLNQIADQLNYSSAAYLSNQFKKITGLTPSHFKTLGNSKRKPLEAL